MTEKKILKGKFVEDKETQKYRRFQLDAENGNIRGTLYIRKDVTHIPDRIVLNRMAN